MDALPPPRRTGKPPTDVELGGCVFGWEDEAPVLFMMPASSHYYLPVFTTADKLRAFFVGVGMPVRRIKKIDDAHEFLDSLRENRAASREGIVVILDAYFTEQGRVRFLQVFEVGVN